MGRVFVGVETSNGLENLADGQVGQNAHGQHHPASDLKGQHAASSVKVASDFEDLQYFVLGDNLFEKEQFVEYPASLPFGQGALTMLRLRGPLPGLLRLRAISTHRGFPGSEVLSKPKLPGGRDLRPQTTVLILNEHLH